MRVARLRLGAERIELTEYLAPSTGRPIPPDSRSQDQWFQHVAIVVSDMDAGVSAAAGATACAMLHRARSGCRTGIRTAGGIEAFYFRDPPTGMCSS
jgi:hypothetical protein